MILVYCENITNRHRYIFDFLLEDILGMKYEFTGNQEEYTEFSGPKFSYGYRYSSTGCYLNSHPLLSETGILPQNIKILNWNELPVFFEVEAPSDMPFDPFAMSFYLITRYEEYLPFEPDEHGRFQATSSLALREGFLRIPLVDMIAVKLKALLEEHFPQLEFPARSYRFVPTFDIDIAYAHLGKGFFRASAAWAKLILTLNFKEIRERLLTLAWRMDDPYDNFDLQQYITTQYGYSSIYFALVGDFGKYDRNTSYRNRRFRKLLSRLSRNAEMGIHPSHRSFLDKELYQNEKNRLEDILVNPVTRNRFHFLRVKFPESFRMLLDEGITDDYSIGYSSIIGFRASTCTPFNFYDLEKEEETSLKLHPFIFMDSAIIDHMGLTPEQAAVEIDTLLEPVRSCGGEAIGIWHNYALSEKQQYKGWRVFLETVLSDYNNQSL